MATRVVGDVAVRVGADVGPLKIGLQDGARSVDRFSRTSSARARALASAVKGVGLAAIAMGGAMAAGASRAITALDGIGKKSAQIGITAEALQELRFAAKSAGVEASSLGSSLERFSKRLGEAEQGFGAAKQQLEFLGIQASELTRIPLDKALEVIADRMADIRDPTERAAVAAGLFGREGVAMVNMLKAGGAGLRQVRQDAIDMGAVVSNELVAKAELAEDRLGRLKDVITAQLSKALMEAAPLLEGMAVGITGIVTAAASAITTIAELTREIISLFEKSEAEIAAFEAGMDRRRENQSRRASRGGSTQVEGGGVDISGLGGLITGALTPDPDAQPIDKRAQQQKARVAQMEREAELEAQREAWNVEAESYVEHLNRMQAIAEEDRIRRTEIEVEAAEEELDRAAKLEDEKTKTAGGGMSAREQQLREHLDAMKRAEEQWERDRAQGIANFWSDITSLMQSENEAAFKIGKAFSVAKAIIDGREAAIGAYKVGARIGGPGLGAAFAAASVLATGSMIQQILNTKPGGGGAGASSAPTGGGNPTGRGSNAGSIEGGEQGPSGPRVSLTLIGDQGFSRAQIVQIAEALNDSTDEGQTIDIRGRR